MFGAFSFQTYLVFWPLNFHSKFQMLFLYWRYLMKNMKWKQHFSQFKEIVTLFARVDKVLVRGKDTLQMQMQKKKN